MKKLKWAIAGFVLSLISCLILVSLIGIAAYQILPQPSVTNDDIEMIGRAERFLVSLQNKNEIGTKELLSTDLQHYLIKQCDEEKLVDCINTTEISCKHQK